jgi:hypothetical protein
MKLLNYSEELTFNRLREITSNEGAHVFPKVRVADVLNLPGNGLENDLFRFGLMAHFDFVVNNDKYEPLFAVEFDGPLHTTSDVQRARDKKRIKYVNA